MLKQLYICRNLNLLKEVQELINTMQATCDPDKPITENISLGKIAEKVNDEYREKLNSRTKWQQIREDDVLLTALRDELKRMSKEVDFTSQAG
ncbi:hypothetical protein ACX0HA_12335 [Flavobacterium hauense]